MGGKRSFTPTTTATGRESGDQHDCLTPRILRSPTPLQESGSDKLYASSPCPQGDGRMRVKVIKVNTIDRAMSELLRLRDDKFWSFRGQRDASWKLGLHKTLDTSLEVCLRQFHKRCLEFPRHDHFDEKDQWRSMFYAQHHGLRTRLLDWTTNPIVALYFAVERILSRLDDEKDFGAIWAIRVNTDDFRSPEEAGDPTKVERWIMVNPPPITKRIVRQSGKFSFHPIHDDGPLEDTKECNQDEALVKIVITERQKKNPTCDIRRQLGIMNMHHAALFPDADGVARFINEEWEHIALSFAKERRDHE
jgi:hypothetical protein